MKKKAFTLIELLVVIAIIAILAAILFPVFAQAKQAAKKTASLSNTKQHNLGSIMYAGDVDDQILPSYTLAPSSWESAAVQQSNPLSFWCDLIQPYTKNGAVKPTDYQQQQGKDLMKDPGASVSSLNASDVYPGYDYAGRPGYTTLSDYAYGITGFGALHQYNNWLYDASYGHEATCPGDGSGTQTNPCMNPAGNGPGVPGTYQSQSGRTFQGTFATNVSSTAVARPAETVIICNGETQIHQVSGAGSAADFVLYTFPGGGDKVYNGGGIYGFVDGHAKAIARNPLNYVTQSSGGYWFMTYFTMSE